MTVKENVEIVNQYLNYVKGSTWTPYDFGFEPWAIKPNFYFKGGYELISFPEDMWLLRRRVKKRGKTEILVKFYYYILPTDIEFAKFLLQDRLERSTEDSNVK